MQQLNRDDDDDKNRIESNHIISLSICIVTVTTTSRRH